MKTIKKLFGSLLLCGLITNPLWAQQPQLKLEKQLLTTLKNFMIWLVVFLQKLLLYLYPEIKLKKEKPC